MATLKWELRYGAGMLRAYEDENKNMYYEAHSQYAVGSKIHLDRVPEISRGDVLMKLKEAEELMLPMQLEELVARKRVSLDERPLEQEPSWTFTAGETCVSAFFYYRGGVRIEIKHDERLIAVGFGGEYRNELHGLVASREEVEAFMRATIEEAGLFAFELDHLCGDMGPILEPEIEHER